MSKIKVCRSHDLGEDDCDQLAQELLGKLVSKFGGSYKYQNGGYAYKHTAGVNALVEARHSELVVNVKLGMMARAFAPQLEAEMNKVLDEYLS